MTSILNTSTTVDVVRDLPAGKTKADGLAILRDARAIMQLNPLIKGYAILPPSSSLAFYKSVPADKKPSSDAEIENLVTYAVREMSAESQPGAGATWRGGWTKRFIPDELAYENSYQPQDDGMVAITHAPMGVSSISTFKIMEDGGKLSASLNLVVTSNRMLMAFITSTLKASVEKLMDDYIKSLESGKVMILEADGSRVEA